MDKSVEKYKGLAKKLFLNKEKLIADLKGQATADSQTGLLNRRGFDKFMESNMDKKNRDFAIFMIDIDHFKKFNDDYGHKKGDDVIVQVADRLKVNSRTGDVLGRYGGEEFIVMISRPPESDIELKKMADRYVNSFRESGDNITISLGFTRYYNSLDVNKWEKTMRRADQALYQAKESGRNRSEFINYIEANDLTNNITEFRND